MTITSFFRFPSPWLAALALATLALSGCGSVRDRDLESGHYLSLGGEKAPAQAWQPSVELILDMEEREATFRTASGSTRFALIEQDTPINDCGGADEEWVKLDTPTLTIDGVTFEEPKLVAMCATAPLRVLLGLQETPPFIEFELR